MLSMDYGLQRKNAQKWVMILWTLTIVKVMVSVEAKAMHDRSFVGVPIGGDDEDQRIACRL